MDGYFVLVLVLKLKLKLAVAVAVAVCPLLQHTKLQVATHFAFVVFAASLSTEVNMMDTRSLYHFCLSS